MDELTPGLFRRRMVAADDGRRCTAAVEDDFHHMTVWLEHDGARVLAIGGALPRHPWNTCPGSVAVLSRELTGMALSTRIWDLPDTVHAKLNCTHLLDTALLAIAQAARGGERRYELQVPDPVDGRTSAVVLLGGREVFRLVLDGDIIVAPAALAGEDVRRVVPRALAVLDDDGIEWLVLLRRALTIAHRRRWLKPERPSADQALQRMVGACHSFQPAHAGLLAHASDRIDVSGHPERFSVPA